MVFKLLYIISITHTDTCQHTVVHLCASTPADLPEETAPYINDRGEWELTMWDVEAVALGAGILGCGGGGSPYLNKVVCQELLRQGNKIKVVTPEW